MTLRYLEITETVDAERKNFTAFRRKIDNGYYPNELTKTTSLIQRRVKTGSTLAIISPSAWPIVEPRLSVGEAAAVTTTPPAGYSVNDVKDPYNAYFDAYKARNVAIASWGDSIISSGNGGIALAEGQRFYNYLQALLPDGAQVINLAIGGKTANDLKSDRTWAIQDLRWPTGARKILFLYIGGNNVTASGQTGWVAAYYTVDLIATIKPLLPTGTELWVSTLAARKNGSTTSAFKDFQASIKSYSNVETYGYKVCDFADDLHFGVQSSSEAINNGTFYQAADLEHPTARGTEELAKYAYSQLFPPAGIHPVIRHCGPIWREPIADGATYITITQGNGVGNGIRSGADDGLPGYYDDPNNIVWARNSDPVRDLIFPGSFNDRSPGSVQASFDLRVPNDLEIADVLPPNTPNEPGVVYNVDTGVIWCLNTMCRVIPAYIDRLNAYHNCLHAGAGINAPPIFEQDLNAGVIPYMLAINLPAGYLYWNTGTSKGYIWPATADDSQATALTYLGTQTELALGSRLAIPPDVTAGSLGITGGDELAVFNALKTYGCVVSDTISMGYGWHTFSFGVEKTIEGRLNSVRSKIEAMGRVLKIVPW